MKKILILNYHFPPFNAIASQRTLAYANHFHKYGFEPTILTTNWHKSQVEQFCNESEFYNQLVYENYEHYKVIRLPILKSKWTDFWNKKQGSLWYKLWLLNSYFIGNLDANPTTIAYQKSEWKYLNENVFEKDYDIILGIFSPHYHLKNLYHWKKNNNTPIVFDHRDLWTNAILLKDYKFRTQEKILNYFVKYHWKKWAKRCNLHTMVSKMWGDKLGEIINKEVKVIYNGFEKSDYQKKPQKSSEFVIVHTGSLYYQQELKTFLDAYQMFIDKTCDANIILKFIGAYKNAPIGKDFGMMANVDVDAILKKYKQIQIHQRIAREEVITLMNEATLLYQPSFGKVPGTYGGKIFEYLGSGTPIIICPKDYGVLDELMLETNAGVSLNTSEEIFIFLMDAYRKWKNGQHILEINMNKCNAYSREHQVQNMANYMMKILENK